VENCQVGVFLAYRSARGHALIDRRLYLPQAWTDDRDRCRAAGIPDEVGFATEVEMARSMLARAFAVGWVTMGEAYGQSKSLRVWLEDHDVRANDPRLRAGMRTPMDVYVVVEHSDDGQPMGGQRCGRRSVVLVGVQRR
jgi:hypothetical protein